MEKVYPPNPDVLFVPVDVPLQIVRLGPLAILATPFEVSTMSGRRIEKRVGETLVHVDVDTLVVTSHSNSYGLYITTREEYAAQHFEGAFTLFGPWSDAAVSQELDRMAADLANGTASKTGPEPPDLSDQQIVETPISSNGVVADGGDFGAVLVDADASCPKERATVQVSFQGAHPRTILVKKMEGSLDSFYDPESYTFIDVQKKTGTSWSTVATDNNPYTAFDWQREGGSDSLSTESIATATWLVRDQPAGTYRIRYHGLAKIIGSIYQKFTGTSQEFLLY